VGDLSKHSSKHLGQPNLTSEVSLVRELGKIGRKLLSCLVVICEPGMHSGMFARSTEIRCSKRIYIDALRSLAIEDRGIVLRIF
jgi:hypothetical protein